MKKIDYLSLDGRCLRTFLIVLEELSVSRAAERLGVTQSAVSHTLNKLRLALDDPLFVRSGRGIAPTGRACALRNPAQFLLDDLKGLTHTREFEPASAEMSFTVAANDLQRNLLFPDLLRDLRSRGIDIRLRFVPSNIPVPGLLGEGRCDFLVTPLPPVGADVLHVRLFDDRFVCFYDSQVREAPRSLAEYLESDSVVVRFEGGSEAAVGIPTLIDSERTLPFVSVPNFSALERFVVNTDAITTQLSLAARYELKALSCAPLPFETEALTMYLVWHRRDHSDPAHRWIREQIKKAASELAVAAQPPVQVLPRPSGA